MSDILIENMSFGYSDGTILEDVSIDIKEGDFAGIIGSNGTGKSTLIKLIMGILPHNSGKITVNHENIGYVPQVGLSVKADFPATVEEVVMLNMFKEIGLFRRPNKAHYQKCEKALETVNMLDKKDKQIGKLSGGRQQRVMIAKALVSSPDILILDEPTAAIDSKNETALYELLIKLNRENRLTIVMVTHSIENIEEAMNKVYVIKDRKVTRRK